MYLIKSITFSFNATNEPTLTNSENALIKGHNKIELKLELYKTMLQNLQMFGHQSVQFVALCYYSQLVNCSFGE